MKINRIGKPATKGLLKKRATKETTFVKTGRHTREGLSYTEARESFLALTPVDPASLGLVAPKVFRSFFSVLAKQNGIRYISFALPDDEENAVFVVLEEA